MSIQLANKVNELCQKIKILNKKIDADTQIIKENQEIINEEEEKAYLYANIKNDEDFKIDIPIDGNVPYNSVISSNNITLNGTGGAVVGLDGTYSISYNLETIRQISTNVYTENTYVVAINNIYGNRRTHSVPNRDDSGTPPANNIPFCRNNNTIILNLEAGDIITIVNKSFLFGGTTPSIGRLLNDFGATEKQFADNNLVIHKL